VSHHELEAMGMTIVVHGAQPAEARAVQELFACCERTFSPFRHDSELSAVNRAAGRLVPVSDLFAEALQVALRAAGETGGLVDPTLSGQWRSVQRMGRLVRVPAGVALDLNGVVKSLAVDAAVGLLSGDGFVSAGGDLATRGPVTVALPAGGEVLVRLGGLATSGTTRRGQHLIDPASGTACRSPWREVTASGATCVAADVAAKAGFVAGTQGPGWLDRRGIPARFVSHAGDVICNAAWRAAVEPAACT
jgi:thiamine biosynthesis lipoprotein